MKSNKPKGEPFAASVSRREILENRLKVNPDRVTMADRKYLAAAEFHEKRKAPFRGRGMSAADVAAYGARVVAAYEGGQVAQSRAHAARDVVAGSMPRTTKPAAGPKAPARADIQRQNLKALSPVKVRDDRVRAYAQRGADLDVINAVQSAVRAAQAAGTVPILPKKVKSTSKRRR